MYHEHCVKETKYISESLITNPNQIGWASSIYYERGQSVKWTLIAPLDPIADRAWSEFEVQTGDTGEISTSL